MTLLAKTRYGTMEYLIGDSIVSRSLVMYGEWAQLEIDFLATLIQPGMAVLDVGAFLGTHTLAFASMVGPGGVVRSFEPRLAIREMLSRNVERNGLRQVTLYPSALGERAATIQVPAIDLGAETNFGGLALDQQDSSGAIAVEAITVRPLDDLGIDHIDFIKIDAEGMEADVVSGALRTLERYRPLIFAECNDLERGSRTLAACSALGYSVYGVLSPAFNPSNLNGQQENIFGDAAEASLLAVPTDKVHDVPDAILQQLAPMNSLDDLALLMLHKAQYAVEVLARIPAARVLGLEFSSPLTRRQKDELTELQTAVRMAESRANEAGRRAEVSARAAAAAQALADHFQRTEAQARRYQPSSVLHWLEALRSKLKGAR